MTDRVLAVSLAFVLLTTAALEFNGGGNVPSGSILAVDTGGCPIGYTEVTAARGRTVRGTPAGGTVGGTVGAAMTDLETVSVTPTSPAHAHGVGTYAVASHAHAVGTYAVASHAHAVGTYAVDSHTHGPGTYTLAALGTHAHETNEALSGGSVYANISSGPLFGTGGSYSISHNAAFGSGAATLAVWLTQAVSAGTPSLSGGASAATAPGLSGSSASVAPGLSGSSASVAPSFSGSSESIAATISAVTTSDAALQFTFCKRS